MSPDGGSVRPPPGARVPDFFLVGHHKSGTTALYEMLRRHPQIFMPDLKEPKFLASDLPARLEPSPQGRLPRTLEQYLELFAPAREDQRAGEASPSYLRSEEAAANIAELQPRARVVAILREPGSFVHSLHLQLLQDHVEHESDLRKAVERELITRAGRQFRRYSDHVRYVEQLERYRAVLAPEQVLVLIYEDFRSDNEGTVRKVLRHLGVDDTHPIETVRANPTVVLRSARADSALRALYGGRGPVARTVRGGTRTVVPAGVRTRMARAIRRTGVYGTPQPPDEALMAELRLRYRPEVEALGAYLGRDLLSQWGYDRRA